MREFVENVGGFSLCPAGVCNRAGDNSVMFFFTGARLAQALRPPPGAARGAPPPRVGDYAGGPDVEPQAWRDMLGTLCKSISKTLALESAARVAAGRWGFKAPHSVYYLPLFEQFFEGRFRFVHVLRDGRDLALGDNQRQYLSICRHVPQLRRPCDGSLQSRLEFWAVLNRAVYDLGRRLLGPQRYLLLRIEDLALAADPAPAVARLLAFLGQDVAAVQQRSGLAWPDILNATRGHEDSYGGRRYSAAERRAKVQLMGLAGDSTQAAPPPSVRQALALFGYRLDDWGLAGPAPGAGEATLNYS